MTTLPDVPFPSFLDADQETAPEHIPLQVLLLTQEVALQRRRIAALAEGLRALAEAVAMPSGDPIDFLGSPGSDEIATPSVSSGQPASQ